MSRRKRPNPDDRLRARQRRAAQGDQEALRELLAQQVRLEGLDVVRRRVANDAFLGQPRDVVWVGQWAKMGSTWARMYGWVEGDRVEASDFRVVFYPGEAFIQEVSNL